MPKMIKQFVMRTFCVGSAYRVNNRTYKFVKVTGKGYKFICPITNTCYPRNKAMYPVRIIGPHAECRLLQSNMFAEAKLVENEGAKVMNAVGGAKMRYKRDILILTNTFLYKKREAAQKYKAEIETSEPSNKEAMEDAASMVDKAEDELIEWLEKNQPES